MTPEIAIEVFVIENTGPGEALRLQSNTVPIVPLMISFGMPLMITLDSLKTLGDRERAVALRL